MLKRFSSIFTILLIFCVAPLLADDCTDGLTEAKALYNSGNYQKAKELFEYVQSECPYNYTEASNWIAKCNDALKPKTSNTKQSPPKANTSTTSYLKVNGSSSNSTVYLMKMNSSKTITVSCSTSYSVYNIPSWCSISNRTSTSFTLNYQANPNTYKRYGSIDISGGGTSIRISLEQDANTASSNSTNSSSSLKVNKSSIVATAAGVTEYITVTCNKAWEIQHPSGGMYNATRSGNSVKVVINTNTTTSTRTDYFNIRTIDGKETIKISLSQSGKSSTNYSSSYSSYNSSSSNKYTSYSSYSTYDKYCYNQGDFEVTWFGANTSICTGFEFSLSAMRLRWGWFQVQPLELMIGYDFITEWENIAYQPTINFVIPVSSWEAIYFGAGPSIGTYATWFKTEAGYRFHWGNSASSDVFLRYDGMFTIGMSIQWSSYY